MAICPFARWEPIPANSNQPHITPTAVVVHSNAAQSGDLHDWWVSNRDGLESHFQIDWYGVIYQYVDTAVRADANVDANGYGVSIETANSPTLQAALNAGDNTAVQRQFDTDKWSPQQVTSLVRLIGWICDTHSIPKQVCADGRHGVGWHEQYANWTTPGHHCPGVNRVAQFKTVIMPAVAGTTTGDVLDMDKTELAQLIAEVLRTEGVSGADADVKANGNGIVLTRSDVQKLLATVNAIAAKLDVKVS